jgi:uncharacterized membrane protein
MRRPVNHILSEQTTAAPSLKHYLILCAFTAAWIDFSHVHRTANSDTLLFSITSRYAWTPFFWEQDRIGMLVPLLTSVSTDPLITLLLQTAITTFMALALPFVLIEIVYPRPGGRLGAVLANALMLAQAPARIRENLLLECCYPQAMFLGCVGLIILGRRDRPAWWRYPASFILFVVAHWVYLGVSVWLMPLAFWVAVIRPGVAFKGPRDLLIRLVRFFPGWASLLLLSGAVGIGLWFMSLANEAAQGRIEPTSREALPLAEWPDSWTQFWIRLESWPGARTWEFASLAVALAGALGMMIPRNRPGYSLSAACLVLIIVGATEYLFMGTREWPSRNEYHLRYIIGAIVCAQLVLALLATAWLDRWAGASGRWTAFVAAGAVLIVSATIQYGLPALSNPRTDLDARYGAQAAELLEAHVDAIGGDYWTVWPLYFYAGVLTSPNDPPYPITFRSSIFRPRWERTHPQGLRVAIRADSSKDKEEFLAAVKHQGLSDPVKVGVKGHFEIYFTRPKNVMKQSSGRHLISTKRTSLM